MNIYNIFLENLINDRSYSYTCEVGCLSGKMSNRILLKSSYIQTHFMVDPWTVYTTIGQENSKDKRLLAYDQDYWDDIYKRCFNSMKKHGDRYKIIRATSAEGSKQVNQILDCVIVDADHTRKPFLTDIITWLPKIKDNGLWINHDYSSGWQDVVNSCNDVFTKDHINRINNGYIYVELTKELKIEFINRAIETLNN
jgi:hypothetical protein